MENSVNSPSKNAKEFFEWVDAVVLCAVVIIFIFLFFFRQVVVQGVSMEPTYLEGDRLIIRSIAYTPQRGDVVVLDSYSAIGKPLVKRVIAIGGDVIDIDPITNEVLINGEVIDEPYISSATERNGDIGYPFTVSEGFVFVMGDNRQNSHDSRDESITEIDERSIIGEAIIRVWPFDRIELL